MTTQSTYTCTVGNADHRCGKPAVYHWVSTITGETFAECAEHYQGQDYATASSGHQVGDEVAIRRYGKTYTGRVTKVGARGAVYVTFTYDNGAERTVRV